MTKNSSKRASADVGLMMTAYNLRRIMNILGIEWLRKYLDDRIDLFFRKTTVMDRILAHMLVIFGRNGYWKPSFILQVNRLSLMTISPPSGGF